MRKEAKVLEKNKQLYISFSKKDRKKSKRI